jgi:hypothetical protein
VTPGRIGGNAMKMNTLKEVYLAELQELHHVEEQLT